MPVTGFRRLARDGERVCRIERGSKGEDAQEGVPKRRYREDFVGANTLQANRQTKSTESAERASVALSPQPFPFLRAIVAQAAHMQRKRGEGGRREKGAERERGREKRKAKGKHTRCCSSFVLSSPFFSLSSASSSLSLPPFSYSSCASSAHVANSSFAHSALFSPSPLVASCRCLPLAAAFPSRSLSHRSALSLPVQ